MLFRFFLLSSLALLQAQDRPNIVLILADDLAWDDLGAFGNKKVGTPNLDRLAVEGMCFDQAFLTISSCSPSRASILTRALSPSNQCRRVALADSKVADPLSATPEGNWRLLGRGRREMASR